jgi:hypothetical protein
MENSSDLRPAVPYDSEGYLIFSVSSANEALPIENASVHIVGADAQNKGVEYNLVTDRSGKTERIALKTPSRSLSLSPGTPYGFSRYNATVTKAGYYTQTFLGLPVFDGVTSIQPALLVANAPYNTDSFDPSSDNTFTE